jgi:hypothetical protein
MGLRQPGREESHQLLLLLRRQCFHGFFDLGERAHGGENTRSSVPLKPRVSVKPERSKRPAAD